jgi:hypothetical protein
MAYSSRASLKKNKKKFIIQEIDTRAFTTNDVTCFSKFDQALNSVQAGTPARVFLVNELR